MNELYEFWIQIYRAARNGYTDFYTESVPGEFKDGVFAPLGVCFFSGKHISIEGVCNIKLSARYVGPNTFRIDDEDDIKSAFDALFTLGGSLVRETKNNLLDLVFRRHMPECGKHKGMYVYSQCCSSQYDIRGEALKEHFKLKN